MLCSLSITTAVCWEALAYLGNCAGENYNSQLIGIQSGLNCASVHKEL